ncbi:MAG: lytic transglycosylase domain-containing protein [Candidatus Berkelbacteria bacterium]|nr:lytic transglycosylase domain-containing protein [Candidatus Berkelbacteria bacterium]
MQKVRSKVKTIIISSVAVLLVAGGYFWLPSILGDSVFPLKYQDTIKRWCVAYEPTDQECPFQEAGILMMESGFNPTAVSPVGALGIAQIMPATGRTIAYGVGYLDFTSNKLFDPEIGIQFSVWQLHVLKQKYGGSFPAALAAYNAGTGSADRLIRAGILGQAGSGGTASYIRNITDYVAVYHKLYQNDLQITGGVASVSTTPIVVKQAQTSNIVWGQMLKNLVKVFTGSQ